MKTFQFYVSLTDETLLNKYKHAISVHNKKVKDGHEPDSGFDLYCPENIVFPGDVPTESKLVNFHIRGKMVNERGEHSAYCLFARSSIAKTPLLLSNNVGIIDCGYRGDILGAFRNLSRVNFEVELHSRLVQICCPTLEPFCVEMVTHLDETERGSGGFGSTGR